MHADCATDRPLCRKFSLQFRRLLRRACEIQELRAGTRLRSQGRTSSSLSQCANRSNFTCREHSSPIGREGSSRAHLANPYTVQTFGIRMRIATGGMRGANARIPLRYFMQMRLISSYYACPRMGIMAYDRAFVARAFSSRNCTTYGWPAVRKRTCISYTMLQTASTVHMGPGAPTCHVRHVHLTPIVIRSLCQAARPVKSGEPRPYVACRQ